MSQDDAAIQRAATLLTSNDINDNKNGAALVINTAANAHSVPKLLRANIVSLLLPKLNSNDEDLVMKACWAVNNLSVHDEGRNACQAGGVLQYFSKVLQNNSSDVIKKACWALTNLARNPEAQKEIIRGSTFTSLVNVLTYGKHDEEKGFALQPLCNLVLESGNQLAFKNANGLAPTVRLLSSTVPRTQELAVTLVSFVTTNHDPIRDELVEQGVLPPLCSLLNGSKTGKLQEYALNSLVNLSLSSLAERAILTQGAVRPVVGLLSSEDPKLQQQASMLLSNLLTNKEIRENVRYFGWVDPVLKLVKRGDSSTLQQVLRVIINITFDEHCRYMLQNANAADIINQATSQASDNQVFSLSSTAIKNLSVPCSAAVQAEVNQKLSSGAVEYISAPRPAEQPKSEIDLDELDKVLDTYGTTSKKPPPATSKPAPKPVDDLDDILSGFNPPPQKPVSAAASPKPSPASAKANTNYDLDLDDLLGEVAPRKPAPQASKPAAPAPKPAPAPVKAAPPKRDLDDLDDLLSDIDYPKKPAPKPAPPPAHDEIDDLLADIDPRGTKAPPPKAVAAKPPPKNESLDDIDDLLADMTPSRPPPRPTSAAVSRQPSRQAQTDDIDDLLNGIGGNVGGYGASASYGGGGNYGGGSYGGGSYGGGDDIDDLLSDLSSPPRPSNNRSQGRNTGNLDAIDDLLADLAG